MRRLGTKLLTPVPFLAHRTFRVKRAPPLQRNLFNFLTCRILLPHQPPSNTTHHPTINTNQTSFKLAGQFSSYDVPSYLRNDGGNAFVEGAVQYATMQQPEKKMVAIDVNEFVRTRDALSSAYMSLSSSIDRAVKAYIDHTNVVLAGDGSLNISYLTQPFDQLANTAHIAQQALHGASQIQNGTTAGAPADDGKPEKRKKRAYKQRDPNAPKRPLTAYFRYLQEQRGPLGAQMKEALGGTPMKPGDLSKEATERWNKLSKDEQQPYRDAYQRALKDYEKEVVKYKGVGGKLEEAPTPAEEPEDVEVDAEHENEDEEDAEVEDDEDVEVGAAKVDAETEESSDEDDDEEEPAPPPPPAPKAASPETAKKTPKSAMKKSKQNVSSTTLDSNIDPALAAPTPAPATSSSSPERKRKAAAPAVSSDAETGGKRKRAGRKTNAEKAAEAAAAPVAQMTPVSEEPAKKKKKKKADA